MFERFRLTAAVDAMIRRLSQGSHTTDPAVAAFLRVFIPEFAAGMKRHRNPTLGAAVGLVSTVVNGAAEDGALDAIKIDRPRAYADLISLYRMAEDMSKADLVNCFPFFERPSAALRRYIG